MLNEPKHTLLYSKLKEELKSLNPGERVPAVRSIMRRHAVSQATVVKSLDRLESEGLLKRRVGLGTFVTDEVLKYKEDAAPVILLTVPDWHSTWAFDAEMAFTGAKEKYGMTIEIVRYKWQDGIPHSLPKTKFDGIVHVPSREINSEHITKFDSLGKPVVFFDRPLDIFTVDYVCLDNHFAGALAADHLIRLGHRKVALIVSEPRFSSIVQRIEGFTQYCQLQNVACEIIDCEISSGDRSLPKVYATLKKRLKKSAPSYSGVFVTSEPAALAVYKVLYENGFSIPGDISVIATDDQLDSDYYYPALTTISSNLEQLAEAAVDTLLARIRHSETQERITRKLKPNIIIRESTRSIDLDNQN